MSGARPRFGFYSQTYLYRSEHFLHSQLQGISRADVDVIAQWAAYLKEFPTPSVYVAEAAKDPVHRIWNGFIRRASHSHDSRFALPAYALKRISRRVRSSAFDLIYCIFGWHACQLLDVLDCSGAVSPLVFHAGGSDVTAAESLGSKYVAKLAQAVERSQAVLCGSEFIRRKLIELGAPVEKLIVHYIGVRVPQLSEPVAAVRRAPFRILAVSRMTAEKGLPHTIRAFSQVASAMPDARLEIIGDGPERGECEALAGRSGVGNRVCFRGSIPLTSVYEAMASADVFVQHNIRTSEGREEAIGGSIIEASAHRLPVVATRSGGVPEAVEHRKTGFVVEPGDESAMATAVLELYRDQEMRRSMGAAGRALVKRKFDITVRNQRLEDVLLSVCRREYIPNANENAQPIGAL